MHGTGPEGTTMTNLTRFFDRDRDLDQMMRRFENFFSPSWSPAPTGSKNEQITRADFYPACDVQETPEAYLIHAELPDVKKEDVKVTVHDNVLSLAGERRFEKEEKGRKYHRVERSYGRFERSFTLPMAIEEGKITAHYKDGVLSLQIPKSSATAATSAVREIKVG
jgi:HSP20 family protein